MAQCDNMNLSFFKYVNKVWGFFAINGKTLNENFIILEDLLFSQKTNIFTTFQKYLMYSAMQDNKDTK